MAEYVIFAHDPGVKNYGYSVVSFKEQNGRWTYRVLECGILSNTLTDLKDHPWVQLQKYNTEVMSICNKYKCTDIIVERFQSRGLKGTLVECIGLMLGYLLAKSPVDVKLITAATWKNSMNRRFPLKQAYGLHHHKVMPPHVLDATLMAFYRMEMEPRNCKLITGSKKQIISIAENLLECIKLPQEKKKLRVQSRKTKSKRAR